VVVAPGEVVVVVLLPTRRPTTMVTVEPGFAWVLPLGF
jgi:hypothetical protein